MGKNPHEVPNGFRNLRGAMALGHSIFCHTKMYRTDLNSGSSCKICCFAISVRVCLPLFTSRMVRKIFKFFFK